MTKDEALRMALDALEKLFGIPDMWTGENGGDVAVWRMGGSYRTRQAIHAIKEALAQPEREWVGLTDEEIYLCTNHIDRNLRGWANEYARAIEAKLKQKNGYAEEKNT